MSKLSGPLVVAASLFTLFPSAASAERRPIALQYQTITSSFYTGIVAVDAESDVALIGLNNGTVAVTKRSATGAWSTGVTLAGNTSAFGIAIALNGGWAMIAEGQGARTVRTYEYVNGVFQPRSPITETQVQTDAAFGYRMAISDNGQFAVISAFDYDDPALPGGDDHGIAYVYQRVGTQWTRVQALTPGQDSITNGKFGLSVTISGDGSLIAIGGGQQVHIFRKSALTVSWTLEKVLTSGLSAATGFGWDVDLSEDGQTLLVGLPFAFGNSGSAWLYRRHGGSWDLMNVLGAPTSGAHGIGWAVKVSNGLATTATLSYQGAPGGPTTAFFAWGNDLDMAKVWSINGGAPPTQLFAPTGARVQIAMDGPWIFVGIQSVNALPEVVIYNIFTPPPTIEDLAVDFGPGQGIKRLTLNTSAPIHGLSAKQMVRGDLDGAGPDDLIVDFGPPYGVWAWMNHIFWEQVHYLSPRSMAVGDVDQDGADDLVCDFDGYGIWILKHNSAWSLLNSANANHLAVGDLDHDGAADIILDFPGFGIWTYMNNSTWSPLHGLNARSILTSDLDGAGRDAVVIDFAGYGIYAYRDLGPSNHSWTLIHPFNATQIAAGDLDGNGKADLVVDFGSTYGIWALRNGTDWARLHPFTSEGIVLLERNGGGHDDVVVDFGPTYGLWELTDSSTWSLLSAISPKNMVVGRFR